MACETSVHIFYMYPVVSRLLMWAQFTTQMTLHKSPATLAFSFSQSITQAVVPVHPGKNQSQESTDNDWGIHIH